MENKKNKIIGLGILFLVLVTGVLYLSTSIIPKALVALTKANVSSKVIINKSLLVGEKVLAKADGAEECVVNVFALDNDGQGVAKKQVVLLGTDSELSGITDKNGKISFKITSNIAKQMELTATIGGSALSKTLMVTFR
jgi:hypothetical protein